METQTLGREAVSTIISLAETVKDENRPVGERQQALKLICQLRQEPHVDVLEVNLRDVGNQLAVWYKLGIGCSVNCAAECAGSVRDTREREQGRRE